MGLLDDLGEPKRHVPPCRVRNEAEKLEPADAKILLEAVSNPDWPLTQLASALKARDIDMTRETIRNHRIGACSCSRI